MKPKLPFSSALPVALRAIVTAALKDEDYGTGIDAIEDYLHKRKKRDLSVLIALAFLEMQFAVTVMVDEVVQRTSRALELLDEAVAGGADQKSLGDLRRSCIRYHRRAQALERATSALLNQDAAKLSLKDQRDLAYKLDEIGGRENSARAAAIWLSQAKTASVSFERYERRARAGLSFAHAKMWDDALPILEKTVKAPQGDGWIADYAYYELLTHAAETNDRERYIRLWADALRWSEREGGDRFFPFARPVQDESLEVCLRFQLADHCKHLLDVMKKHRSPRTISPTVRQRMEQARMFVESQTKPS